MYICVILPLNYPLQREESLRQGDIPNLNVLVTPFVEQLDAANFIGDLLGKHLVARDGLDFDFDFFDFLVIRHVGDVEWVEGGLSVCRSSRGLREVAMQYWLGLENVR